MNEGTQASAKKFAENLRYIKSCEQSQNEFVKSVSLNKNLSQYILGIKRGLQMESAVNRKLVLSQNKS